MNILTFDIEEWYLEKVLRNGGRAFRFRQFDETFAKVLDELSQRGFKATFFCVGKLAKDFPQVIRSIASHGHEVGCHSDEHIWINKLTVDQLRQDTIDAIKALEDVSGQRVTSYRAPAFSITPNNKWAVPVLVECGIENDASIFPAKRDIGGYSGFPQDTPCLINFKGATLKEFPISLTSFMGKAMAYSGGGYFRLLPYSIINRTVRQKEYNICYFHLNDLINQKIAFRSKSEYEEYFKEPGTLKNRIVRYAKTNVGTSDAFGKLLKLLDDFSFTNIRDCRIDWSQATTINL